jgi:hypothetical protein
MQGVLLCTWYPGWESYFENSSVKKETVIRYCFLTILIMDGKWSCCGSEKNCDHEFYDLHSAFQYFILIILQILCFTASVFSRFLNYIPGSKSFQTFGRIIVMGHQRIAYPMVSVQIARQYGKWRKTIYPTVQTIHPRTHPSTLRISTIRSAYDSLCLRLRDLWDSLFFRNYFNNLITRKERT